MKTFSEFLNEADEKPVPKFSMVLDIMKAAEPFKGIKSSTDQKQFYTKIKKELKKIGMADWKIQSAIDQATRENAKSSGRTMVSIGAESIARQLFISNDIVK